MSNVLDILKDRGFIAQVTYEEELYKALENDQLTFYLGIDPTADSLHIGHFIPIMAMAHLQQAGHKPIALCGGGTAMIGDPSGKSDMRKMLSKENIGSNISAIKNQLENFVDFSNGKAKILNNADWLLGLNYVDFIRDIGSMFSVNRMLTAECYKQRMEKGLTFLEFNYMIMQAYDFLKLYQQEGCRLEIGGDDQWSNMLAGADLIRRKERTEAYALTCKLIMTHDGKKMGKTEKGALWLDSTKTSPFDFYQYWRNVGDQDVERFLGLLTFLPMDEVRRLGSLQDQAINEAKRVLAFEITKIIHGQEEAQKAADAAQSLFSGVKSNRNIPSFDLTENILAEDNRITTLLVVCGLCSSRSEARKMVQAGAVAIADEKTTDIDARIEKESIGEEGLIIRKGKKNFCRLLLKK